MHCHFLNEILTVYFLLFSGFNDDNEDRAKNESTESEDSILDSSIPELTQRSRYFTSPKKSTIVTSPSKSVNFKSPEPSPMKVTPTKSHSESEISQIKFDEDVVENTPKRKSFSTSYLIASPLPSPIKDRSFHTPSFLKTPRQTDHMQSPTSPNSKKSPPDSPISATPMPNYESMLSPALRQELRRFGLKVIPRRKAIPLLKHIYEETHPVCRKKVDFENKNDDLDAEEDILSSSQESQDTVPDVPEESMLHANDLDVEPNDDLASKLILFIQNDVDLYRQTLMYEPIWLEDLFQRFKEELGASVKLKLPEIQTILDNECITFRTRSQHAKNTKRNAKAKK